MKLVWIKLIPWNWQNRITIASKKIARVTAALEQGLGLRLLRTEIDEIFHPLQKEQKKNKNWDEFESFERWMTERRWRFYVPWRWHLIFQTARFVREVKKSIVFSLFWSQTTFFHRRSLLHYGLFSNTCRNIWMLVTRIYSHRCRLTGFNNEEFWKEIQKETI